MYFQPNCENEKTKLKAELEKLQSKYIYEKNCT